ncbi:hypothetical protein Bca52824_042055 [Brassica carinata]|uniref:Hydrophobic seed protein domain-containing protein n=1 Tax=Brassica carinata TaxID=52824 RepID=A0A8X7V0J7_BRACI|nr:hypothetical protein Bca52824_042055 [Brassica carinata]
MPLDVVFHFRFYLRSRVVSSPEVILLPLVSRQAHGDGEKVRPSFPVCGEYLPSLGLVCRPTPVVGLVSLLGVIEKQILFHCLADLEAAVCLCTVLKANILGIKLNLPINLSVLLNVCSRKAPKNFQCA